MAILDYEIGGNEIKVDASEGIADISGNRSLIIEQLTAEEPVKPEAAYGLTSIEDVFAHFLPNIDIEFDGEEGQPIKENLRFSSVADFSVKNMTEQSGHMRSLAQKKAFYEGMIKQLRSNKVLQRALEDPDTKQAFIAALAALREELEAE